MQSTVSLGDEQRQGFDVGRPQLRIQPPVEQLGDHRVGRLEFLQHGRVGRVAGLGSFALGQAELVKENLLELLGRAEIEVVADVDVDLRLKAGHLAAELDVERGQRLAVDGDAGGLHLGKDRDERHLDVTEEPIETGLDQRLLQRLANGQRGEGVEADPDGRRNVSGRRERHFEPLVGDIGDRLAAQRGVEEIRGDLRVEGDGEWLRGAAGDVRHDEWLGFVADDPGAGPQQQIAEPAHRIVTFRDQHATVAARQRERLRHAPHRSRVVHQQRGPDLVLAFGPARGRQPGRRLGRVLVRRFETVHERRVGDGRPERRGQIHGSGCFGRPEGPAFGGRSRRGLGQTRRTEIHRELKLRAVALIDQGATLAARGPRRLARNARRRHTPHHGSKRLGGVHGGLAGERRQPIDQRAEFELAEQPHDLGPVVVGQPRRFQIQRDGEIANDSAQLAAREHLLSGLDQLLAQLVRLHFVEAGVDSLDRAELAHELGRRLLADAGDAWDVVRRVALEGLVLDHLVRPQLEALPDPGRVVEHGGVHALARRHEARVLGHDLQHVEIAGHNGRVQAARVEIAGDRADDIVRFVAGHLVDRDPKRGHDLSNLRELRAQVVRHRRPSGLVSRELLVAERRTRQVEAGGDVLGLHVLDPAQQDAAETEDGVDELALAGREGRQRVVAAVDEAVAVEQHQARHCGLGLGVGAGAAAAGDQVYPEVDVRSAGPLGQRRGQAAPDAKPGAASLKPRVPGRGPRASSRGCRAAGGADSPSDEPGERRTGGGPEARPRGTPDPRKQAGRRCESPAQGQAAQRLRSLGSARRSRRHPGRRQDRRSRARGLCRRMRLPGLRGSRTVPSATFRRPGTWAR